MDQPYSTGWIAKGARVFECPDCGLRLDVPFLSPSLTRCQRCGATLLSVPANSLHRSLALVITGLVLVLVANTMPFMSLNIEGRFQQANLITGVGALLDQGLWELAAVVLFTTVVAPMLKLGALCYVLLGLRMRRPPRDLPRVFGWLEFLQPWSMIEVYLLGVFVAYVKLIAFATIEIGAACYALALLMLVMVGIDFVLSPELIWREMEQRGLVKAPAVPDRSKLLLCETCGLTAPIGERGSACPRCGAGRHFRKRDSMARSWALVITAMILYVPANIFPVMTVISFGSGEPDTILSGVKELLSGGMWPLALLVFFASITVPVLKIVGLMFLLLSTRRGSRWRLRDRTVLYRIVEAVGRWSMIDIFMLSILAGLVRLGAIATIEPGVGAIAFCAVVIITMLAATAFDPRLMWDAAGENR
ncbi:MAG: paraquat-inducible protein A [Stellaceae bacterium]